MKYLAIDYGARRLGLAICDPDGRVAVPLGTFARGTNDANGDIARLISLIRGHEIESLVLGRPGGSEGSEATLGAARRFAARLQTAAEAGGLKLPLEWWDERYSTAEALRGMAEAGVTQRSARESDGASSTDARAAMVILQGFLDARNDSGKPDEATVRSEGAAAA